MTLGIFDLTVGSYLQTIEAMISFMKKSRVYFEEEGVDLNEVTNTRLHSDMQPFSFQIMAVVCHSIDVLKALDSGVFDPEPPIHEPGYDGLELLLEETCQQVGRYSRQAVNGLEDVEIRIGQAQTMNAKTYLLSQGMPNFYFHAATAFDILRMRGAPIGKLDFLGHRRIEI